MKKALRELAGNTSELAAAAVARAVGPLVTRLAHTEYTSMNSSSSSTANIISNGSSSAVRCATASSVHKQQQQQQQRAARQSKRSVSAGAVASSATTSVLPSRISEAPGKRLSASTANSSASCSRSSSGTGSFSNGTSYEKAVTTRTVTSRCARLYVPRHCSDTAFRVLLQLYTKACDTDLHYQLCLVILLSLCAPVFGVHTERCGNCCLLYEYAHYTQNCHVEV
jgi:hypothetical protein